MTMTFHPSISRLREQQDYHHDQHHGGELGGSSSTSSSSSNSSSRNLLRSPQPQIGRNKKLLPPSLGIKHQPHKQQQGPGGRHPSPTSLKCPAVLRKAHNLKRNHHHLNKSIHNASWAGAGAPRLPSTKARRDHLLHHQLSSSRSSSTIASVTLKNLLWSDIQTKSLSKRLQGGIQQLKVDGMDKDAIEKKDPWAIDSNLLEKTQGPQRGLVLQIGGGAGAEDESMLLLGQIRDTMQEQLQQQQQQQEVSTREGRTEESYSNQFDAFLNKESGKLCSPLLQQMEESDMAKAPPAQAASSHPLRRSRHTRNNSRSAPSLLGGDLLKVGGNFDGMMTNDPNDILAEMMESDSFEYCALNHIVL